MAGGKAVGDLLHYKPEAFPDVILRVAVCDGLARVGKVFMLPCDLHAAVDAVLGDKGTLGSTGDHFLQHNVTVVSFLTGDGVADSGNVCKFEGL